MAKMKEAGTTPAKQFLRETPVTVANVRSDEYPPVKTSGIKARGKGAAKRGFTSRGPMA